MGFAMFFSPQRSLISKVRFVAGGRRFAGSARYRTQPESNGDCPGLGKEIHKRLDAEERMAMTVCEISRSQVFATFGNPVGESAVLLDGQQGIHEDGVARAVDESRSTSHPHPLLLPGRKFDCNALAFSEGNVLRQRNGFACDLIPDFILRLNSTGQDLRAILPAPRR
jgi:hypothetical protein